VCLCIGIAALTVGIINSGFLLKNVTTSSRLPFQEFQSRQRDLKKQLGHLKFLFLFDSAGFVGGLFALHLSKLQNDEEKSEHSPAKSDIKE
jgi:hypothetical protein